MKEAVQIYGGIRSIINIFVSQMVKGTILVVAKTNGENQKEMVYGGQVKQVMIQKKLLAVVTSLKPIIVVWRTGLKGKFKEVRPRYSVLPDIFTPINLGLFKNCQDWSNDSLETCKMKCSGNNIGRFIRFVFTGVM